MQDNIPAIFITPATFTEMLAPLSQFVNVDEWTNFRTVEIPASADNYIVWVALIPYFVDGGESTHHIRVTYAGVAKIGASVSYAGEPTGYDPSVMPEAHGSFDAGSGGTLNIDSYSTIIGCFNTIVSGVYKQD